MAPEASSSSSSSSSDDSGGDDKNAEAKLQGRHDSDMFSKTKTDILHVMM